MQDEIWIHTILGKYLLPCPSMESRAEALHAFFYSYVWVMFESNLICQIWVKKETKKVRLYDISHFATKVRRCSESNLICLSQIWVKRRPKKRLQVYKYFFSSFSLSNGHLWQLTQIVSKKSVIKNWKNSDNLSPEKPLVHSRWKVHTTWTNAFNTKNKMVTTSLFLFTPLSSSGSSRASTNTSSSSKSSLASSNSDSASSLASSRADSSSVCLEK